ncbi:MAG: hypothetical protein EAY81_02120, partial [Bacteroidetes bacterium]
LVNNKQVTTLSNNEQYQINLNEGTYQIQAKIDWMGSESLSISLKENEVKTLEVGCSVFQDKRSILLTILTFIILIGSILIYDEITLIAWVLILGLFIVRNFILRNGKSVFYYFFSNHTKYLYIKEL